MSLGKVKIISAGAGSGKTYRLTQELSSLLEQRSVRASGIIATTFTKKAAAELKERVRVKLLESGLSQEANELTNALIGTVHGLGVKLLQRFAFEAGVSPAVEIIPDEDQQRLFNLSMAAIISLETIERIELLGKKLGLGYQGEAFNWRKEVREIVEVIRTNDFSPQDIADSRQKSWESFAAFLPAPSETPLESAHQKLALLLSSTQELLENNETDSTKKTLEAAIELQKLAQELQRRGYLPWPTWAKLAKFKKAVAVKSQEVVVDLADFAASHTALAAFQNDIRDSIFLLFDCARDAIQEYDTYKKNRGQIDYTDMEVLVLRLLEQESVRATLGEELDLLLVDEFQDTSPIQLALFLRLSQLAKQSIWVGDPKQSIYGFRGAEPGLMAAVIRYAGGIQPENIQEHSWRSREELVYTSNAIFVKAFPDMPPQEVRLLPMRLKAGNRFFPPESPEEAQRSALWHWHYELDGGGRLSKEWIDQVLARSIRQLLDNPPLIRPKGSQHYRPLQAGDMAILCRSNKSCESMAKALEEAGTAAALARTGLLQTAEITLLIAMLKYMLSGEDSLSAAEIMLLAERQDLADIIDQRLDYLETLAQSAQPYREAPWGGERPVISRLEALREPTQEFSPSELINYLLEDLDIRRLVVAWGNGEQRLSNIDELRRLAIQYEENCHRLQQAASVGGLLLYLAQLANNALDKQGAGERPEAVNVLTYHRSKGLEWPVVVCHNLDDKLRADLWGKSIISEVDEIDPAHPLRYRWLRYWVNPYDLSGSDTELGNLLAESHWQQQKTAEAKAEEARLLYVGITRARDYLILPTAKTGAPWLDRVYQSEKTPVLDPHEHSTPFVWEGYEIDKLTQTWMEPRSLPVSPQNYTATPFIAGKRTGRQPHQTLDITAEQIAAQYPRVASRHAFPYFPEISLTSACYSLEYGQAISAFLLSDQHALPLPKREEMAEGLIQRFALPEDADTQQFLAQADAFEEWLAAHFPSSQRQQAIPIRQTVGLQQYRASIDCLFYGKDRPPVLIQQCLIPSQKWEKKLQKMLPSYHYLAHTAEEVLPEGLAAAFVHLPIQGILLPLLS